MENQKKISDHFSIFLDSKIGDTSLNAKARKTFLIKNDEKNF